MTASDFLVHVGGAVLVIVVALMLRRIGYFQFLTISDGFGFRDIFIGVGFAVCARGQHTGSRRLMVWMLLITFCEPCIWMVFVCVKSSRCLLYLSGLRHAALRWALLSCLTVPSPVWRAEGRVSGVREESFAWIGIVSIGGWLLSLSVSFRALWLRAWLVFARSWGYRMDLLVNFPTNLL